MVLLYNITIQKYINNNLGIKITENEGQEGQKQEEQNQRQDQEQNQGQNPNWEQYYLKLVAQGCFCFLDEKTDEKIAGSYTQEAGPCACIIVKNQDNSRIVLAHVDSGNDITDKEFALPQWVKQCGGNNNNNNNNNVIVEVYIGYGQVGVKVEDGTNRQEKAILGFERTIQQLQSELGFVYNGRDQSQDSKGGMILRNGYRMITDRPDAKQAKPWNRIISHKILQNPENKNGREVLKEQISFDNEIINAMFEKIEKQVLESIIDTTDKAKHNITSYIENTLILPGDTKAVSEFCQKHDIKVPLIPLDEIDKFKNGLTKEFRNRIDNQPYMKSQYDCYWQNYVFKRQELSEENSNSIWNKK